MCMDVEIFNNSALPIRSGELKSTMAMKMKGILANPYSKGEGIILPHEHF